MTKSKTILFAAIISVLILPDRLSVAQKKENTGSFQPADQYLISQFKVKDVIFLGELHRIKEQVTFVCKMIPLLRKNGICILFSEFASFKDTKRIDSLITAKTFNDSLAQRIQFDNAWYWGYREYVDLYLAAWKTNQDLLPGEKPFRIIGIEIDNAHGTDPEQVWAHIIDSLSIKKGEKALVYCGMHHAFTNYFHPYLVNDTLKGFVSNRAGNWLYKKYPDKTITVLMHGPWYGYSYNTSVLPCNGRIDSLLKSLTPGVKEIGFSTSGDLLSGFKLSYSLYSIGYPDATLRDLCQGYIVVKPVCELNPVTVIPDFINRSNINETIVQAEMGNLTIQAFNDSLRSGFIKNTENLTGIKKKFCK
jgi:hypothetical protein